MTKGDSTGGGISPPPTRREARTERLAAALKANLQRRKAQARQRAAEADEPAGDAKSAPAHDSARVVADKRSV